MSKVDSILQARVEPTANKSVKEGIKEYLLWKESYAEFAAKRYKVRLEQFSTYIGANVLLKDITGNDIITYHRKLQKEWGYAPGTVAYSIRIMKDFISFWNGRNQTHIQLKEIRNIRYVTPEKEMLTEREYELLQNSLDERFYEELIVKLVFSMLWDTGCRISELCEIQLSDIIEGKEEGMRSAKIRRRKTMRYNVITWSKETNRLLNLYLGIRLCFDTTIDSLFITKKYSNNQLTQRTVQRWCTKYIELAGIDKKITPHSFRHAKAHRIISQSQNVRDVQAILGHRNPASSFNYLNLNFDALIDVSLKYLGA